jgi:hypothetical protein
MDTKEQEEDATCKVKCIPATMLPNKQLPSPRVSVSRIACSATATLIACLVAVLLSVAVVVSFQAHQSHLAQVQQERWRNKAAFIGRACNSSAASFVVMSCNATYTELQRDDTHETLTRTMQQLERDFAPVPQWLGCDTNSAWCMYALKSATHGLASSLAAVAAMVWTLACVALAVYSCRVNVLDRVRARRQQTRDMEAERESLRVQKFVEKVTRDLLDSSFEGMHAEGQMPIGEPPGAQMDSLMRQRTPHSYRADNIA